MSKALSPWFDISLCTLGYLCATKDPASAQVTSDGTVNTQVTENDNTAEITEGETRGNNLFHSFQDFSIKTGNEAFFNNADSISNIFSRVTGGNISDINGAIRANGSANLSVSNGSKVQVASFNRGDAGNGGNINLTVEKLFGLETGKAIDDEANPIANNSNDIDASSNVLGLDGTVNINTSRIDPLQGARELLSNVVEAKQATEQTCSADREGKANNGLAIAGRGGITPAPDTPLNSENISQDKPAQVSIPEPLETSQGKIQPARGIIFTESGRIILTAYPTNNAGERIPEIDPNCN